MATSGAENFATIGAILREIVSDGVANILPAHVIIGKLAPFKKLEPEGLKFVMPTMVKRPQGFTFTRGGTGPASLNPARAGKIERAEVQSNNIFLVDVLDKEMIDRTQEKSGANAGKYNKATVKKATAVVIPSLLEAAKIEDEACLLYGQSDRGQIAIAGDVTSGAATSTMTFTKQTFAPGVWIGQSGIPIDVFDTANTFLGTLNVVDVNPDTRVMTVEGSVAVAFAGAVYPLKVYRSGTRQQLAAGSAPAYNDSIGLEAVYRNTGLLWNIDASLNSLWQTYLYDCLGAPLNVNKLMKSSAFAAIRGAGKDFSVMTPVSTWADLSTDETLFRRWTEGAKGRLTVGPDALEVIGATGPVAIKAHAMMKRGLSMGLNLGESEHETDTPGGDIMRIGTTEWKFDTTGSGDILHYLPGVSGYEIRLDSNKALFVNSPGRGLLYTNITDNS